MKVHHFFSILLFIVFLKPNETLINVYTFPRYASPDISKTDDDFLFNLETVLGEYKEYKDAEPLFQLQNQVNFVLRGVFGNT